MVDAFQGQELPDWWPDAVDSVLDERQREALHAYLEGAIAEAAPWGDRLHRGADLSSSSSSSSSV